MTSPERFAHIHAIFDEVCDLRGEARERALDARCGDDVELRTAVLRLIAADERDDAFLEPPTPETVEQLVQGLDRREDTLPQEALDIDELLGPYRVVRKLAEGGMGAVYLGSRADRQFEQWVAIKILRRELSTARSEARMRRERQTLARLAHPYIARLLDGGATPDGRPYLVMEYIEGLPIDRACEERSLGIQGRLRLLQQVCEAVSHAHRHLVVHRDIKPNNILVTAEGTPRLLDFGIAKLVEVGTGSSPHRDTVLAMTPAFASPEQKRGEPVGTATDVFSLGRLLETLVPDPPAGLFGEELRSIAAKATAEHEDDRYASVDHLTDDLRRLGNGLPVEAHGASTLYGLRKFVRRHALSVTLATAVAATALAAGFALTDALRETERERQRAVEALAAAEDATRDAERARREATDRAQELDRERLAAVRARELAEEANVLARAAREEAATRASQAEEAVRRLEATLEFVRRLFRAPSARGRGPDTRVGEFLSDALDELRHSPPADAASEIDVRRMLAMAFVELARYDEGLRECERAVEDVRRHFGESHPRFRNVLVEYGDALCRAGDARRGVPQLERGLALFESDPTAVRPEDHVKTLGALARGLLQTREFERGERLALRAVEIARAAGIGAPLLSDALVTASSHAFRLDARSPRGLRFAEEAIESLTQAFGPDHALTQDARLNLAHHHLLDGRPERALEIGEPILQLRRTRLPRNHPALIAPLALVGVAYKDLRRLPESERALREALLIHREANPGDHDQTVNLSSTLAATLARTESIQEAIELYDQAIALEEKQFGRTTRTFVRTLINRGVAKNVQRRYPEAMEDFRTAHEIAHALFGPRDEETLRALVNQGTMHFRLGELEPAVRMLDHVLAARRALLHPRHPSLADTLYTIAKAELGLGRWDYAAACLREAADILKASRPDLVDRIVRCLVEHADCRRELGFEADAERDLLEALSFIVATDPLPRDHLGTVLDRLAPLAERFASPTTLETCRTWTEVLRTR